jgi:methylmalonyl-CoA mutase
MNHKIRILTAGSLFDGHDAAINVMRRILQASGAEVIHLGHNRSVQEIVSAAIQEDVQGIALTSYQGGHMEFFRYLHDLLHERGCGHIRIFGGGGGTILPEEQAALHAYGITRLYSPDDGRQMGLQGMIDDLLRQTDFPTGRLDTTRWQEAIGEAFGEDGSVRGEIADRAIGRLMSAVENEPDLVQPILDTLHQRTAGMTPPPVLGITGTGGAGKSSLIDELVLRFLRDFPAKRIAILSVDPSKRRTGGALLGDRIRMNSVANPRVFMRSVATRQSNLALSRHIPELLYIAKAVRFDLIILETSGIGQSDTEIVDFCDVALYVMTPEYGAASQLEKIDMLDYADVIAINKSDRHGAQDALREVRRQFQRNHQLWERDPETLPVVGTIASQFNDPGVNRLHRLLLETLHARTGADLQPPEPAGGEESALSQRPAIVPSARVRYLSDIAETIRRCNAETEVQAVLANRWQAVRETLALLGEESADTAPLHALAADLAAQIDRPNRELLAQWPALVAALQQDDFTYHVRGKPITVPTRRTTLSGSRIPRIALPRAHAWGDILRWLHRENVPGSYPYTAGVFPFKRQGEDPTRMFAGEGGPERTNKRFHYVSLGMAARRLSTAFDSVTLYGEDPAPRPDIYGKVGNSGVSVASLDDAKKLYSGFDLCDPRTSVSMTINGPAATVLAFFLNAAIDQQCEKYIRANGLEERVEAALRRRYDERGLPRPRYDGPLPEGNDGLGLLLLGVTGDRVLSAETYAEIRARALSQVRGTVQADILKEDQAQNTCIFSTEFSLRLMGDVQQYFIDQRVRNFYSVSISGYHIAEAGANPITQLAFTLANGFTFLEYYLARGMAVDDFAPNFSFFFSNGMDPEYSVIGRVARRIWARALRERYGANERAQMLKYHIQTSGRSLHAQEIQFNDIRTTLQALLAIYDNANSLHTNAYDEAITTPTEESVRRAIAIQMIITHEFGLAQNENPLQGAFIIEELTDLVEEAVLAEFDRLTERGGVLGAMERMYQRNRIQEESLLYESKKHSGELPIIGVNTFLGDDGSPTTLPQGVIRATEAEKQQQIAAVAALQARDGEKSAEMRHRLQKTAITGGNLFAELLETVKFCSLGQITHALYAVGGQYRRSM